MLNIRFFQTFCLLFALHAGAGVSAQKEPIKAVVSFGDSLTDAGTYWFRFTTNPGYTWAQLLALHYGQEPLPNQHISNYNQAYKGIYAMEGPGGLNYAQGGAKVNSAYSVVSQDSEGVPISANVQVVHYLKQHKRFRNEQLVTLWIGTNDVAFNYDVNNNPILAKMLRDNILPSPDMIKLEQIRVTQSAKDTVAIVNNILANGAKRLVVFTLPDMGELPWFRSDASRKLMTILSSSFNQTLITSLPQDDRLLILDMHAFIDYVKAHQRQLGFTHLAHADACKDIDQDYCYPNALKSPGADQTHIFAASEHMSTKANIILFKYVLKKIEESEIR